MHISAFQKQRRSLKLFSDFNTLQFSSVMGMVVFVLLLLLIFMTIPPSSNGIRADLPKVIHPVTMKGANREDAMKITIFRDEVYFGEDGRVDPAELPGKIANRLKGRYVEHKIYIAADARVPWRTVKRVLQPVRDAGILRVAFMAEERKH